MSKKIRRIIATLLIFASMFGVCSCGKKNLHGVADYGTYGSDFARNLAKNFPYRKAFTDQERAAGSFILSGMKNLGYEVKTQTFLNDEGQASNNYYVYIPGKGFTFSNGKEQKVKKTIVIGAHYDSAYTDDEVPDEFSYDGISDNASGVGCLMTIASQIKEYSDVGYDIYLVAFGAGNSDYRGAREFYNMLVADGTINNMEMMVCIDSIYAGDKVYASAGYNSLNLSQKYRMRRPIYQVFDVANEAMLSSRNNFYLYYNESGILTDLNGDGVEDVYREVSANKSDYVVFDEANIPIVYIDSADYFFDSMADMKESKNLYFKPYDGEIRNKFIDSSAFLDGKVFAEINKDDEKNKQKEQERQQELGENAKNNVKSRNYITDRLELRINNIAYVIMEILYNDPYDAMVNNSGEVNGDVQNTLNESDIKSE